MAKREQLGLSYRARVALLVASTLCVVGRESAKAVSREAQLPRIQVVLKMNRPEALAKLQG